ncbi:MAG TPA: hypothetical protein VNJ54_10660 [Plantibacter sp.]|uniref:hypothetical protein n=2 Tax=unclassified Plantibacter TaxID=2624265 RepID=UPI002BACB77F|nr:hypothetical protein [Plantibacter sp.]
MRRLGGAAATAALVLLMTACSPGAAIETASPAATPAPTSSPTPTWPSALGDTSCEELIPQDLVDATFGVPLVAGATDPARAAYGSFWTSAYEYAGGLSCEWGAVDPSAPTEDRNGIDGPDNWLAVAVDLIPRGAETSERIASELGGSTPGADPAGACDFGTCSAEMVIGEYWVSAFAISYADSYLPPTESEQAVFDHVASVVGGLGESRSPQLPEAASSWPSDCEGVVSRDTLAATLELSAPEWVPGYSYRSSNLPYGAVFGAGGQACGFAGTESGRMGSIETLPGAGVEFAVSAASALESPNVSAVEIPGLSAGSVIVRIDPMVADRADLEMNFNGTWVVISLGGASSLGDGSLSAAERLTALATAMVAN